MQRDKRIKKNSKGEFRAFLCYEDLTDGLEFCVYNSFNSSEKVLTFIKKPIKIPFMKYMFSTKIKDKEDYTLSRVVRDLTYINPSIDLLGLKKMTEYIILFMAKRIDGDPVLKYEDIHARVVNISQGSELDGVVCVADLVIVYERGSRLTAAEKREMSKQTRATRDSNLKGEIIHNAANSLIEELDSRLQITKPRVLVKTSDKDIKTVNTLKRHMRPDTINLLALANKDRPFNREAVLEKFEEFLELPEMTVANAAEKLKTSKSTIIQFKKIKQDNEINCN